MKKSWCAVSSLCFVLFMQNCGNDNGGSKTFEELVQQVCDKHHVAMELTIGDCMYYFTGVLVVSYECLERLISKSSDDVLSEGMFSICGYSRCTVAEQSCNFGDTITLCNADLDYWAVEFYCSGVCQENSMSYIGSCGKVAPDGTTSDVDVCWCQ